MTASPRRLLARSGAVVSLLALAGLLTGCAQNDLSSKSTTGGGTSGSSSGAVTISLDKSSLMLQGVSNSGTLPSANFQVTYTGDHVVVGAPTGTSVATWISLRTSALSIGHATYLASATTTAMTAGTYTTTLRFSTARADGSGATYVDLPVSYVLTASEVVLEAPKPEAAAQAEPAPVSPADEALAKATGIEHILQVTPRRQP